jgi:hypothetical protein
MVRKNGMMNFTTTTATLISCQLGKSQRRW